LGYLVFSSLFVIILIINSAGEYGKSHCFYLSWSNQT